MPLAIEAKRNLLEQTARDAYAIWSYRAGKQAPWEELPQSQREAWQEVVTFLLDDGDCLQCGEPLICPRCNAVDMESYCAICDGALMCPVCDAAEIAAAQIPEKARPVLVETAKAGEDCPL